MPEPAAQYLRVSSHSQLNALPGQIQAISSYAARHGYTIVETYSDVGRSGVSQARREGLARLLRDIQGEVGFRTLLVMDVTRWGRYQNPDEAAYLEFMCRLAGVEIRYCNESFHESGDLAASIQKNIRRVMAAEYSRQLSERCRVGLRRAALAGSRTGGVVPYGFARCTAAGDGEPQEILMPGEQPSRPGVAVRVTPGAEHEVATVRRIFDLFVNQPCGPTAIARMLNAEGISHRADQVWTRERILAVLTNELAIGVQCFNKCATRSPLVRHANPASDWMRVQVFDPIVDPRLFQAAAAGLKASKYKRYTNADLIERLRRLYRKHGRLSHRLIAAEPEAPSAGVYAERFGSLKVAYRLAGFDATKQRRPRRSIKATGDAEILQLLEALCRKEGRLSARIIDAARDLPSSRTIAAHFGGLRNAYALIGVKLSRRQSRERG